MPKCYDLDFVKRLFKVIDFFKPLQKKLIVNSIEKSLCENILRHVYDLHSALQWIHVALQKKLVEFRRMLCSLIANKYFYKLIEMYPENTRNPDNPIFHEIFGQYSECFFRQICMIFVESFFTNVILE
uniref:Uncharacterized protein n=1 Tax=Panagrolaimus superbus TaxID=310955 RepID=A0A914Z468_9BILA